MSKGSIVLVPFPFTDLSGQKVRPALVLFSSTQEEDCIVAFISSVKQEKLRKFEIPVPTSISNGLKINSIIKIAKLATLQKKIILGELGQLDQATLSLVNKTIKELFLV